MAVRTGKSEHVVGKCRIAESAIGRSLVNKELAVNVEIQKLVKALASDISTELKRVVSDDLADIVRPLEGIPHLRQFTLSIVANGESTAHLYKRKSFVLRTEVGMYAQGIRLRAV